VERNNHTEAVVKF